MLKVAMVYPLPSPSSPQHNSALSVIYPGRAAEDAGHEVTFWDARIFNEEALWANVQRADVVAISSLSGYMLSEAMRIAKEVRRRRPTTPIIWGGVHVTFQPIQSLKEDIVDYVVIGEGEVRFPKLIAAIENGKGWKDIDGIGYKKSSRGFVPSSEELAPFETRQSPLSGVRLRQLSSGREKIEMHDPDGVYEEGEIVVRKRGLSVDLKAQYVHVLSPSTEPLFLEAAKRNEVLLQTSRGCNWSPTSCEFCSVAGQYTQVDPKTGINTSVYRYIPFELLEKDIRAIYALHPFTFLELEDENSSWFLKDWRYAELLKSLGVTYHLHLRSDQLQKEETIKKLAETGCIRVHIGAESGNDETLKLMRKNEHVSDHFVASRLLSKYGIGTIYTWIIGNPGESIESIFDTLRVTDELSALHLPKNTRSTIYVLMPLPGTIAFERAKQEGWPLPQDMQGWTEMSAAFNPTIPAWINNLYFIAGFHHNRHHKAKQNWPGWWRLVILPFELMIEWRWKLGVARKNIAFFSYFKFEYWAITRLLKWRSPHAVGEGQGQVPKLLERLIPGLAGH
jgi:anaerobic magnesium-protoporphyrin IX monomethyl ester cyclase